MPKYDAMKEIFEEVTILGKPALFTCGRVNRDTIPSGYHAYDIRHDDLCRGDAVQLKKFIMVNHWGTLILNGKIKLHKDGYRDIEPKDLNYGTGDCRTMKDYMAKYPAKTKPPRDLAR
jgi:hypothetical protein